MIWRALLIYFIICTILTIFKFLYKLKYMFYALCHVPENNVAIKLRQRMHCVCNEQSKDVTGPSGTSFHPSYEQPLSFSNSILFIEEVAQWHGLLQQSCYHLLSMLSVTTGYLGIFKSNASLFSWGTEHINL